MSQSDHGRPGMDPCARGLALLREEENAATLEAPTMESTPTGSRFSRVTSLVGEIATDTHGRPPVAAPSCSTRSRTFRSDDDKLVLSSKTRLFRTDSDVVVHRPQGRRLRHGNGGERPTSPRSASSISTPSLSSSNPKGRQRLDLSLLLFAGSRRGRPSRREHRGRDDERVGRARPDPSCAARNGIVRRGKTREEEFIGDVRYDAAGTKLSADWALYRKGRTIGRRAATSPCAGNCRAATSSRPSARRRGTTRTR